MAQIVDNNKNTDNGLMIGKLALNYKKITNEQYIKAIAIQKKESGEGLKSTLNEILVKYDFLTREDMNFLYSALDILTKKRKEKRFGAIAIRQGLLKKEDLLKAVETQKTERLKIGNILKNLGLLTDSQCEDIINIQKAIVVKLPSFSEIASGSPASENNKPVIFSTVEINVSEDGLAAVAVLPEDGRAVDHIEIKKALKDNGICFGEISEHEIKENLKLVDHGLTSFVAAKGQRSQTGTPGELRLHFTPRVIEPCTVDEHGNIDCKDRDDIPSVKAGGLLAERNDMAASLPGKNIFGEIIEVEDIEDVNFVCGDGVSIDESGLRLSADHDGEPYMNLDGTLSVLRQMNVDNIDGEAGNLCFDGNIFVRGAIKSDFEVRGKNLEADEIFGVKISIDGDIDVEQGITGAEIRTNGNLRAAFLKNCKIICAGEIQIKKEIIDSEIIVGGSCHVNGGILSSKICSGSGIGAVSVGFGSGGLNRFEIGMGKKVGQKLTEKFEKTAYMKGKEITILLDERDDLMNMISITNSVIKGIRDNLRKNEEDLAAIETLVDRMEKKTKKPVATGRLRIKEFQAKIKSETETAATLIRDKTVVSGKLSKLDGEIKSKKRDNERCLRKIYKLEEMADSKSGKDHVRVVASISDGTKIFSPNAALVLKNDFSNVEIREVKTAAPADVNGKYIYKLEITGKS